MQHSASEKNVSDKKIERRLSRPHPYNVEMYITNKNSLIQTKFLVLIKFLILTCYDDYAKW